MPCGINRKIKDGSLLFFCGEMYRREFRVCLALVHAAPVGPSLTERGIVRTDMCSMRR